MLLVALSALPVAAQAGPIIEGAAEALRQDPIYVHPDADLSAQDADGIHEQLRTAEAGPVYIAVLPVEAADEAGGDAGQVLQLVGESVGRQGTYAVVVGNQLRAGATPDTPFSQGEVPEAANDAAAEASGQGTAAVLDAFLSRLATAAADSGEGGQAGGGSRCCCRCSSSAEEQRWWCVAAVAGATKPSNWMRYERWPRRTPPPWPTICTTSTPR